MGGRRKWRIWEWSSWWLMVVVVSSTDHTPSHTHTPIHIYKHIQNSTHKTQKKFATVFSIWKSLSIVFKQSTFSLFHLHDDRRIPSPIFFYLLSYQISQKTLTAVSSFRSKSDKPTLWKFIKWLDLLHFNHNYREQNPLLELINRPCNTVCWWDQHKDHNPPIYSTLIKIISIHHSPPWTNLVYFSLQSPLYPWWVELKLG